MKKVQENLLSELEQMKDLIQIDNTTLSSRELENEEKFETICVSDQRKEFIRNVLKRIGSKNTNFLLSGSEGIGKVIL